MTTAPTDIAPLIHEVITNLGFDADAHAVANQMRCLDNVVRYVFHIQPADMPDFLISTQA